MRTSLFAIVIALSACSKSSDSTPPSRPARVTDAMVATADRYVELMTKLSTDLEASAGDCAKATAALRARGAEAEKIRPDVEKMISGIGDDADTKSWFDATYSPRMKAAGGRMRATVTACQNDRDLGAAMEANLLIPRRKKSK
jgi:hypothetical protein